GSLTAAGMPCYDSFSPQPQEHAMSRPLPSRRSALLAGAAGVGALALSARAADEAPKSKGNIKQSVCRWCYGNKIPLEKLAEAAKKIGYQSVELLSAKDVLVVKKFGLTCAMMNTAGSIGDGINRKGNHARIEKQLRDNIEFAAAEGLPNVL